MAKRRKETDEQPAVKVQVLSPTFVKKGRVRQRIEQGIIEDPWPELVIAAKAPEASGILKLLTE